MNGLMGINLELSSKCNKSCFMCGRRKLEKQDIKPRRPRYGYIPFSLLEKISKEIPKGILIQFHNDGEPLMYPQLKEALALFSDNIRTLNTNGKLLLDKIDDIMGNLDSIVISVIQDDADWQEQYHILLNFIQLKARYKLQQNLNKPNIV